MSSKTANGWIALQPSRNEDWNERFKDRPPHIFIGICSFGDIPHEVYESHMHWALKQGAMHHGKFAISFGIATRSEQYRARNKLIREATKEGADFLLMIDDDQTLHSCVDILDKFWELGQPIAGGLYYSRGAVGWPVVMKEVKSANGHTSARFMTREELPTEPAPVDVLGGGCHWVDMRVFDFLREPHFWPFPADDGGGPFEVYYPHPKWGLDVHFCMRAREAGYECWLHPGVKLGHLRHQRDVIDESTLAPVDELRETPEYQEYMAGVYGAQHNERCE